MSERGKPRRFREGDPIPALARTAEQWREWMQERDERPFRGTQVFKWLHARNVLDPSAMTDLPKAFRAKLADELDARMPVVDDVHEAADGTRKLLLRLADGVHIESVLIPMADEGEDEPDEEGSSHGTTRVTQCISTQAGCAMGCAFCASGEPGLRRHLGPDEIIAQVLLGRGMLREGQRLSNVVLMGMGEPLHNYDASVLAVRILSCNEGVGLSTRRLTISTVGLVPELERLGRDFDGRVGLAVSLHAADDETRSRLIPANRRYPLGALMEALRRYPLPPRRRITIEYALIRGVNDDVATARKLVKLLRGIPVKVNLIPLNRVEHSELVPSEMAQVLEFQKVLTDSHHSCFVRRRRGDDISAACGQLAGKR